MLNKIAISKNSIQLVPKVTTSSESPHHFSKNIKTAVINAIAMFLFMQLHVYFVEKKVNKNCQTEKT